MTGPSPDSGAHRPRLRLIARRQERVPYLKTASAIQVSLNRQVELRILPGGSGQEETAAFFQELRDLARLDHPGFLQVYGNLNLDGRPAYLVPLRDHPHLGELLQDRDFTLEDRCLAVRSLASAYAAAHAAGIVLGPILPSRIAWDRDAGVAYFLHHRAQMADWSSPWLRHTPLQERPASPSPGDDVFLWGLTAFSLLTRGQHAYGAGPENLRPLRSLERQVSPRLAQVIEASLAWDPSLRPQSGPELHAVLQEDRSNLAVNAPPPAEVLDIRQVSGEVLRRVDALRSSGQVLIRPPQTVAGEIDTGADAALRGDGTLVGEVISLKDWLPAAERLGLQMGGESEGANRSRRWLASLLVLGLATALVASWRYRQAPSEDVPPSRSPSGDRPRLARPGQPDVAVEEVLSYRQEILPEDFPAIFRKLQAVILAEKLPPGQNDSRRLMALWIRYRRDPKAASRELQDWLATLRQGQGADGS